MPEPQGPGGRPFKSLWWGSATKVAAAAAITATVVAFAVPEGYGIFVTEPGPLLPGCSQQAGRPGAEAPPQGLCYSRLRRVAAAGAGRRARQNSLDRWVEVLDCAVASFGSPISEMRLKLAGSETSYFRSKSKMRQRLSLQSCHVDTPPARLSARLSRVDAPGGSRAPGLLSWRARPFALSMDILSPRLLAPRLLDPWRPRTSALACRQA